MQINDTSVYWLLKAMGHRCADISRKARTKLIGMDPDVLLPRLEEALRDDDADVRNASIEMFTSLGAAAVPRLVRLSTDIDVDMRHFACTIMGNIKDREALPALVSALDDDYPVVVHTAAEALGKIGDDIALGPLLTALKKSDFWSGVAIIDALGELGDERAVIPLLGHLDNELLGPSVIESLGKIKSPVALPPLIRLLESEIPEVRLHALKSSVAIQRRMSRNQAGAPGQEVDGRLMEVAGKREFREFLLGLLGDQETEVKRAAVMLLGWLRDEAAAAGMIELLKDEQLSDDAFGSLVNIGLPAFDEAVKRLDHPVGVVRQGLVRFFGFLDPEHAAGPLRTMLADELSIVRAEAALTLGKLGVSDAVDDLVSVLLDESADARQATVTALSHLDPKVVCSRISPLLCDSEQLHRHSAAETMGHLRAREGVEPLSALLDDPSEVIREVAVKSLGLIGCRSSVAALIKSLDDECVEVKYQAIISLGKMKDPLVLEKLLELLGDPDAMTRYYAIRALKEQGSERAVPSLIRLLYDNDKNLAISSIEALGSLGGRSACGELIKLAESDDDDIIRSAAEALGELRCPDALPVLMPMLSHPHWSIRCTAAIQVARIGGESVIGALSGLLFDEDLMVSKAAVRALCETKEPRVLELLMPLMTDGPLCETIEESVLNMGSCVEQAVLKALDGASVPLLVKGFGLLKRLGTTNSMLFIERHKGHEEAIVRSHAAWALGMPEIFEAMGEAH